MNLNQVTVPSRNISRAIAFYQQLGLKLIVESEHYARFECPDGNATFSVQLANALPEGHGVHVYFECGNLDEKVDQLRSDGVVFDELPTDQSWLWREARLRDPDNNHIILYFAGENRLFPPWRIN